MASRSDRDGLNSISDHLQPKSCEKKHARILIMLPLTNGDCDLISVERHR